MYLSKITPMFLAESEVLIESVPITMGEATANDENESQKQEILSYLS